MLASCKLKYLWANFSKTWIGEQYFVNKCMIKLVIFHFPMLKLQTYPSSIHLNNHFENLDHLLASMNMTGWGPGCSSSSHSFISFSRRHWITGYVFTCAKEVHLFWKIQTQSCVPKFACIHSVSSMGWTCFDTLKNTYILIFILSDKDSSTR